MLCRTVDGLCVFNVGRRNIPKGTPATAAHHWPAASASADSWMLMR